MSSKDTRKKILAIMNHHEVTKKRDGLPVALLGRAWKS